MPDITGFGHVDLSVTDLDRSEAWYTKVLGAKRIVAQRVDDPGYEVRVFVEPKSMALFAREVLPRFRADVYDIDGRAQIAA